MTDDVKKPKKPKRIKAWAVFDPSVDERRTDSELETEALKKARRIDGRVLRLVELRRGEVVVDVDALVEAFELLVTPEMLAQLDAAAERDGVPRTEWVRQAIAARLRRAK